MLGAIAWSSGLFPRPRTPSSHYAPELLDGLFVFVVAAVGAYVLGLACHSVARLVYAGLGKPRPRSKRAAVTWVRALPEDQRIRLGLYFWYLRSTCWNLAVALVTGLILLGCAGKTTGLVVTSMLGLAFLLIVQGYSLNGTWKDVLALSPPGLDSGVS